MAALYIVDRFAELDDVAREHLINGGLLAWDAARQEVVCVAWQRTAWIADGSGRDIVLPALPFGELRIYQGPARMFAGWELDGRTVHLQARWPVGSHFTVEFLGSL